MRRGDNRYDLILSNSPETDRPFLGVAVAVTQVALVRAEIDGELAMLTIDRGELNSLNESLVAELAGALANVQDQPGVETIVLAGRPDIFMAGADLPFFARCLLQNDLDRILRFTRACHELLKQIETSPKRVVAWVRGPAIGAGLELALACRSIVAAPTAKFALPETGLGIYPGMGGTQRAPRRIGAGLARWLIGTGAIVPAAQALEIGLVDAVCLATTAREAISALAQSSPASMLSPKWQALDELFGGHRFDALVDPSFPAPSDASCVRALVQLRTKAPLALRRVERLIDRGMGLPLADGIELEFAGLREIFATEDARAGILSFGKHPAEFVGR